MLTEAIYVLTVSAGALSAWPTYMAYYDLLADGFRSGHLHLAIEPPTQLLAQTNPFDPAHSRLWLPDASLFGGHYYFYWGPLPALLLALIKSVFRIAHPVGDQYLVFGFFSLAAVATTFLLGAVRRRLFPSLPYPFFGVCVLACNLGNPVLYLLASSSVYQAAISGGQGFLMAGMYFGFSALSDSKGLARGQPPLSRLLAAGTMWSLAIACRLTLTPAVLLIVLTTAMLGSFRHAETGQKTLWGPVLRNGTFLTMPIVLVCVALLLYNWLRFGSWMESGIGIQLTSWVYHFSPRYFLPNIEQYLLRGPRPTCRFPYLVVPYEVQVAEVLPRWFPFLGGYTTHEPVAGMAWSFPVILCAPVAVAFTLPKLRELLGRGPRGGADPHLGPIRHEWNRCFLWCALTFAILSSVTLLAPLGLYLPTMRYLGDVRFGVGLLGALGMWTLLARSRHRWQRRLGLSVFSVVGGAAIVIGMLLGYQGYTGHFERFNPALAQALVRTLSFCQPP